jgi:hypothetical protein
VERTAVHRRLSNTRLAWQLARVVDVVRETARTTSIVLDAADWPGHLAGQHVDVRLTAEDGYQAQRSYSIASAPEDEHLLLTVERCSHLDTIEFTELPVPIEGCEECLKIGSRWVHLRMCMECGKIGCCDDSPNRHASRHAHEVSHPIIRSAEPGEDWRWCYIDNLAVVVG